MANRPSHKKANSTEAKSREKHQPSEPTAEDAALTFKEHKAVQEWARELRLTPHRALALLRKAFEDGVVLLPINREERILTGLKRRFPNVEFRIIGARLKFADLCASQLFHWIRDMVEAWDSAKTSSRVYIAIGGGVGMEMVCRTMDQLLSNDSDTLTWLQNQKGRLQFINATAGGQPLTPQRDSSYLAVYLANHAANQDVGLFSLAENPTVDEESLLKGALENPCIIVSGIGAPSGAYCLDAMKRAGLFSEALQSEFLGEFLFHPILEGGSVLWEEQSRADAETARGALLVKTEANPTLNASPKEQKTRPIFASLFPVKLLRRASLRSEVPARRTIGIIHDTDDNREEKARLLTQMLFDGYFSHVMMSSDLGAAILRNH